MPCGRPPRAGSVRDSCRPGSKPGARDSHGDRRILTSGIVIVDAQGVVRLMFQGPPLHADDVLQMVKHALQGT